MGRVFENFTGDLVSPDANGSMAGKKVRVQTEKGKRAGKRVGGWEKGALKAKGTRVR
jgi:hypothetical protein